ncbi:unnamed protein product [Rhizoctonia solani]|uniref:CHAT domain-containing protein n=1 Tax=Rhizoctonia solani TaxID=456999 RepID=A0A8H3HT16_9AGAM|nr:unnamed protein product [Rhizoctonia solani]
MELGLNSNATDSDKNTRADDLHSSGGIHLDSFQSQGALEELGKAIGCFEDAVALTDEGDPNLPERLAGLGAAHTDRYQRLGELTDLEKAVECFSRALTLTPDGHPDMSSRHASLGVSCRGRYRRLGELADLKKAIECDSRALALTPDSHPDLSRRHASLGVSYTDRYQRLGELTDLEKAIECHSRALALTPDGHPDVPDRHASLGVPYTDRYRRLGELADLEKAIECDSRALALTPNGHPHMPTRHASLGVSYSDRYKRLGDLADLEKAIECFSRALKLTPDGHPDVPDRQADLGVSYTDRYQRLGDLADLEEAIECHSRALKLTPDGHPDMSRRHASLGVSYTERCRRLGERGDFEKAIEYKSLALALTPDSHPDMSSRHASLGVSYTDRWRRLGELADLEKAIECFSRALKLTPDGHPDMLNRHAYLGVSYTDRYQRLGELGDLKKAIECKSRALALTPDGHPDAPNRHASLGVSYRDRYQRLGELADIDKAIECESRALALTPDGHPNMPDWHASLGKSYTHRYQRLSELADLEKAIEHHSRALPLTPDDHPDRVHYYFNYASTLLHCCGHTPDPSHLEKALQFLRNATQLPTGAPLVKFHYALEWTKHASNYPTLNLIEAYQTAVDLLPQFIWLGATTNQRYQDLSSAKSLAVKACHAAIQSSDFSTALEWLEHARCVVWNQSLMLRSPLDELHTAHPELASQLELVSQELHGSSFETQASSSILSSTLVGTLEQDGQRRRHLAMEYNNLLARTRRLLGFENFLLPKKANQLIPAADNGVIAVINCHETSCDALLILPGNHQVRHLHLPDFNEDKAQGACFELSISLKQKHLRQRGVKHKTQLGYEDRIEGVLGALWTGIVRPVLQELKYMDGLPGELLPHITWCPTGSLSFLPLHAAGDYNQPHSKTFQYVVSSYTPTLSALLAPTHSQLNRKCRVLAVGQATTPGKTPLPATTKELTHLKTHTHNKAEYSQLTDAQATTTAVLDAMEKHDWVHLACHAHQNLVDSTKSGFFLHDGTLDLAAINQRSFKNKGLAFLSACQTATGDETLPDEAIHLASGMLMAGYPSVIATMWSVVDDDAPFVADKVYAQLMKDGKLGNGEAGRALHDAVAGLREKVGEKEFARWVPYIHIGS